MRAEERCVAIEMLRSVFDTIRLAGAAGDEIDTAYAAAAIRNQLSLSSVFRDLTGEQLDRLAHGAELLMNDSDVIHNDVIYTEGEAADAVYLVRAGTIKLSQATGSTTAMPANSGPRRRTRSKSFSSAG